MSPVTTFSLAVLSLLTLSNTAALPVEERTPACDKTVGITPARAQQVKQSFANSRIIPDVVPSIEPTTDLEADYNGKQINLGQVFSTAETVAMPHVVFTPEQGFDPATTNYTFLIVDPDATSPQTPILRYFLHALYYNVHPDCISGPILQQPLKLTSGAKALSPYLGPTPASVQNHRYTFLIYRQPPGEFKPMLQLGTVARAMFDLQQFVTAGNLKLVGGNYFLEGLGSLGSIG